MLAAAATDGSPVQSIVSAAGVFVGLIVGLGAPFVVSTLGGRASRTKEQHQAANEILQLWQREETVQELLAENLYLTRRMLLLLGNRLQDRKARESCLNLVGLGAQENPDHIEIVDAWSTLVREVGRVYRDSA